MGKISLIASEPETPPSSPPPQKPPEQSNPGLQLIILALKLLSQRTVALAAHAIPVMGLVMVFALAWHVLDDPTAWQIGTIGLFSVFFLLLVIVRRPHA